MTCKWSGRRFRLVSPGRRCKDLCDKRGKLNLGTLFLFARSPRTATAPLSALRSETFPALASLVTKIRSVGGSHLAGGHSQAVVVAAGSLDFHATATPHWAAYGSRAPSRMSIWSRNRRVAGTYWWAGGGGPSEVSVSSRELSKV